MLLAIDAGNTNIVFALFDGERLLGQWRIATDPRRTSDEYGIWLLQIMQHAGVDAGRVRHAIMSSVVPQTIFALRMLCRQYFHTELMLVGDPAVKLNMRVSIDRPNELGADRLVNAVAAWKRYHKPMIIIDFGTATTFDVVGESGEYLGGVIAPGVNLSLETLHRAAAKLPNIAIVRPPRVTGKNTVEAMQSGIYYGYVGLIEGIVSRIKQEYQQPMFVIATGGLASLYIKATPVIEALEPDLIIEGLRLIFEENRS